MLCESLCSSADYIISSQIVIRSTCTLYAENASAFVQVGRRKVIVLSIIIGTRARGFLVIFSTDDDKLVHGARTSEHVFRTSDILHIGYFTPHVKSVENVSPRSYEASVIKYIILLYSWQWANRVLKNSGQVSLGYCTTRLRSCIANSVRFRRERPYPQTCIILYYTLNYIKSVSCEFACRHNIL